MGIAYYNPQQGPVAVPADDQVAFDPSQRSANTGVNAGSIYPGGVSDGGGINGGMTGGPIPTSGQLPDNSEGPGGITGHGPFGPGDISKAPDLPITTVPDIPVGPAGPTGNLPPSTTLTPGQGGNWDMDGKTGSVGDFLKALIKMYGGQGAKTPTTVGRAPKPGAPGAPAATAGSGVPLGGLLGSLLGR